jgi:chromosome segregation ATPase
VAPDPSVNLQTVLQVLQFIAAAIVIPGTFALVRVLWAIREKLAQINGSVGNLKQWVQDHDQRVASEEKHHEEMHDRCAELHQERLLNLNAQVRQLWGRIGDRRTGREPTD